MMQRLCLKASRKAGFSATVSLRALIRRALMESSLAQDGINPYLSSAPSRSSSICLTARMLCVGAMLKRASTGGSSPS